MMTLDEALTAWKEARGPNNKTTADLLETARTYWLDEMIADDTFSDIVRQVIADLRETV